MEHRTFIRTRARDDSLDSEGVRRAGHTWWPHMRLCAAIMMAFIPEAHTLLMVVAGVPSVKPER